MECESGRSSFEQYHLTEVILVQVSMGGFTDCCDKAAQTHAPNNHREGAV